MCYKSFYSWIGCIRRTISSVSLNVIDFRLLGFIYIVRSSATLYYHEHISVSYMLLNILCVLAVIRLIVCLPGPRERSRREIKS